MLEVKDGGSELHISRPRLVALGLCVLVSPIYLAFTLAHQPNQGALVTGITYAFCTVLYIRRRSLHNRAFLITMAISFVAQVAAVLMLPFASTLSAVVALWVTVADTFLMIIVASLVDRFSGIAASSES